MDQTTTGQFIKNMRKECGLTQREVAEKLNISEKTVSKWETGKGLPDVGLMLPLCKILKISVNELLSGQKLDDKGYVERAEENIAALLSDKCSTRIKFTFGLISFLLTLASTIILVMIAGFGEMQAWLRVLIVAAAILTIIANVIFMCIFGASTEIFECPECSAKFAPTLSAYIAGPHTLRKRKLRCPRCGKKSWCRSFWRS